MLISHQEPRYRQDKYLVCKVSFSIQPTNPYVAQELPKHPWPGTGLPWRISGPLNRRLGLFGCSSAAESGHAAAPGAPDRYRQPARQHRGASWPGCLFAHPAVPALPSVCHCLLSATVILSQNSPIPIWQSWIPTPGGLTRPFLDPPRPLAYLLLLLCGDTFSLTTFGPLRTRASCTLASAHDDWPDQGGDDEVPTTSPYSEYVWYSWNI